MPRLTLSQVRASRIPQALGLCSGDARVVEYVNEATQRLLSRGTWVGTYGRYRICATNGCITWPRQIETIEAVALCGVPIPVRNEWFEFLEQSAGVQQPCNSSTNGPNIWRQSGGQQLYDRGVAPTFDDIRGVNKKVKVYCDVTESGGAQIILMGFDENNNWIRTQDNDGNWRDGEYINLTVTPVLSTKLFTRITDVIKPITNGNVRLYEYNISDTTQRAIAVYEPSETTPSYRRSFIQALCSNGCNTGANSSTCTTTTVTVEAKLAFIPVANDTDFLLIGNIPALKEMCRAVKLGEFDSPESIMQAQAFEARAVNELQQELNSYLGNGAVVQVDVRTNSNMGVGPVESLI